MAHYRPDPFPSLGGAGFRAWANREMQKIKQVFGRIPIREEFLPGMTLATPGDFALGTPERQIGVLWRFDDLCIFNMRLDANPTWTTGSGRVRLSLPYFAGPTETAFSEHVYHFSGAVLGGGYTPAANTIALNGQMQPPNDYFEIRQDNTTGGNTVLDNTHLTSGAKVRFMFSGVYSIQREL